MSLKKKISEDFKTAFKERKKERAGVLRLLLNAIQQKEIQQRAKTGNDANLSDETVLTILQGEIKKRNEAAKQYQEGNRPELAQKEEMEAKILKEYLPEQLSEEEVRNKVREVILKIGASSRQDMGRVIGAVMGQVSGQAEGSLISKIAKEELGL